MKVDFYFNQSGRSPVQDFISGLSKPDKARFKEVYDGVLEHGLECQRVEFRQLEGKLWEIKFTGAGGKYRIAYVLLKKDWMVWLHAFKKKTQQTPKNDLELAKKRMKEVLES